MNFIKSAKGKLITIVLTFMLLFNFIMPKYTYAAGTGPWVGLLVEPITDLVCSISDAILNTMQKLMVPGAPRAVAIRNGWDMDAIKDGDLSLADLTVNHVGRYLSGNLDPVSGAITTAIAGGIPGAIVAAVAGGPITWGAIAGAAIVGGIALLVDSIGGSWLDSLFQNQAYPIIYYSPAAIFSNRIPALDVNFLNPASNFDQQYQLLLAIAGTDKEDYTTTMRDALVLTEEEAIDNWNLAQKIKEAYDAGPGEARNQYLQENLAYKEPATTEDVTHEDLNQTAATPNTTKTDSVDSYFSGNIEKENARTEIKNALGQEVDDNLLATIMRLRVNARLSDNVSLSDIAKQIKEVARVKGETGELSQDLLNKLDQQGTGIMGALYNYFGRIDSNNISGSSNFTMPSDYSKENQSWETVKNLVNNQQYYDKAKEFIQQLNISEDSKSKLTPEQAIMYYQCWIARCQNGTDKITDITYEDFAQNGKERIEQAIKFCTDIPIREQADVEFLLRTVYDVEPLNTGLTRLDNTSTGSGEEKTDSGDSTSGDTSTDSSAGSLEIAGNPAANSAVILGPTISKWYIALRNLAIVGLLIVLVYVAIRIVLSSISDEKAKYKIMLKDWVIALLLIFFIHYVMLGMLTVVDSVTRMLDNITFKSTTIEDKDGNSMGETEYNILTDQLFSQVRWQQSIYRNSIGDSETAYLDAFGYAVMYATLVMYTLYFTVRYIKRVVYMAFLTIISPMVALTYPIDKVGDKKAQAFDTWFREYLYNLIIQPIHLLIYIVLVSSALDFAIVNPLYGIVAIGFMLEAEKFIKMLFGVKGKNGALGTFATAAVLSQGVGLLESASSAVANKINPKQSSDDDTTIWQKQLGEGLEEPASLSDSGENETVTVQPETDTTPSAPTGGPSIPTLRTTPEQEQEQGQTQAQGQGQAQEQEQGQTVAIPVPVEVPVAENEERRPRIRGFTNGMRSVFGTNKDRLVNSDIHKKAAAMATNAGLRGLGIGTLGTLGLAAGLATDGKTLPVVLGAMAAGNAIGGSAAKIGINSAGAISQKVNDVRERYNSNGKPTQRQIQAFLKDPNQRTLYRNTFGPRDYRRKMQQRVQLAENGLALKSLSEDNDGKIAMKWMDEGIGAREATALVKIGREDIQRKHLMDPSSKEYNNLENRIKIATNDPQKREQMMEKIMEVNRVDPEEVRKTKKSKQLVSSDIEEQGREKQKKMQEKFQQETVNGQEQNGKETKPEEGSEAPRSHNNPREQGDHSTSRADVNNQNEETAEKLRKEAETKAQSENDEQKEREETLLGDDAQEEPQDDQNQ